MDSPLTETPAEDRPGPDPLDPFDFALPEAAIALRPVRPRDAARLLVVRPGADADGGLRDAVVSDLPQLLRPGDVLVVNDTRVIPAALRGERPARPAGGGGAVAVHVNLIGEASPGLWRALARPGRRLRPGDTVAFAGGLSAVVEAPEEQGRAGGGAANGAVALRFDRAGPDLEAALRTAGAMPLPPYIERRRAADAADADDYQTVYAAEGRSVAAPTAGLHFTPALMERLAAAGVGIERVSLDVGPGTFLPIGPDSLASGRLHAERCRVNSAVAMRLAAARAEGGRIVAVGTTSLRTLETAATSGKFRPFEGETTLFIRPGFAFHAVDVLMTNFHLPKSSLYMLVCAFAGTDVMQAAYRHAVSSGYRFYSYGDASLLERA